MTSEMPITQLANTEITLPITLKLNKFQSNILLPAFVLNRVGTVKCSKVFMKFEGSWECSVSKWSPEYIYAYICLQRGRKVFLLYLLFVTYQTGEGFENL